MNSNKLFFISLLLIFFNIFNSDLENQGDYESSRQIQGRGKTDVRSEEHHWFQREVDLCNHKKLCKLLGIVGFLTFISAGILNTINSVDCSYTINEVFHNNQTLSDIGYRDCSITVGSSILTSFFLMLMSVGFISCCKS